VSVLILKRLRLNKILDGHYKVVLKSGHYPLLALADEVYIPFGYGVSTNPRRAKPQTLKRSVFAVEGHVRRARPRPEDDGLPAPRKVPPIEGSTAVVSARAHLPTTQPSLLRCYRRELFVKILPEGRNGAHNAPES